MELPCEESSEDPLRLSSLQNPLKRTYVKVVPWIEESFVTYRGKRITQRYVSFERTEGELRSERFQIDSGGRKKTCSQLLKFSPPPFFF